MHLGATFKLSCDANLLTKLTDVLEWYLNPPHKTLAPPPRHEKSNIQALDRTQPGLPFKKSRGGTMTHDCKRNGNTTLCAALNLLEARRSAAGRDVLRARILSSSLTILPNGLGNGAHLSNGDRLWLSRLTSCPPVHPPVRSRRVKASLRTLP